MEVFNLFSGLLTQQGLARIDSNRDRQAMVPDFRITITQEGQPQPVLHELKVISASRTRYKVTQTERGVDKRSKELHGEYVSKARKADQPNGSSKLLHSMVVIGLRVNFQCWEHGSHRCWFCAVGNTKPLHTS